MRPHYQIVLDELDLLVELAEYQPMVIGTPPLDIDIASSDIDISCTSDSLVAFESDVIARFSRMQDFVVQHISDFPDPAVRAAFLSHGWEIELFCQTLPIEEQHGVRHFHIEERLLQAEPHLRSKVLQLKRAGQKTEPAFATLLGLSGDPYEAMLELEGYSEQQLAQLLADRFSDSSR